MSQRNGKLIKYMYKILTNKKENIKEELDKTNLKLIGLSYFISFLLLFIVIFSISSHILLSTIFSIIFSAMFFIPIAFLPFLNFLVPEKLKKYEIYNKYGKMDNYNSFIYTFLRNIISSSNSKTLLNYSEEILYINSLSDIKYQEKIKSMFLNKIQGDEHIKKVIQEKKEELLNEEFIPVKESILVE